MSNEKSKLKILESDLSTLDSEIAEYLGFNEEIKSAQDEKTNAENKIVALGKEKSNSEVEKLLEADGLLYMIKNNEFIRTYGLVGILAPPILIGWYKALTGQGSDFSSMSGAFHYFFSTNNEIAESIEIASELFGVFHASGGHIFKNIFNKQFEEMTGHKVRDISEKVKEKANYARSKIKEYSDAAGKTSGGD